MHSPDDRKVEFFPGLAERDRMFTCGWCGKHYVNWQNQCVSCGGPMPPLPGMELGSPPPGAPRTLPKGFAMRTLLTSNFATIFGLVITGFSSLFTWAMLVAKPWVAIFPGLFLLGGLSMLRYGWKQGRATLRAFRHGEAVQGKLATLEKDTTTTVNGKHPWKLIYHFQLGNELHEGKVISFDSTVGTRTRGQPLWVLYVEKDPAQNTLYPPIR